MSTPRTCHSIGQIIDSLRGSIGLHPKDTLLCIAFSGTRSVSAIRLRLPDEDAGAFSEQVTNILRRYPPHYRILLLAVTRTRSGYQREETLLRSLRNRLRAAEMLVIDAAWTDGVRWQTLSGESGTLPPSSVSRVSTVSPPAATLLLNSAEVGEALDSTAWRPATVRTVHAVEAILNGRASSLQVAQLLRSLERASTRDLVLLQLAFGKETGLATMREIRSGVFTSRKSVTSALALGNGDEVPQVWRLKRSIGICRELLRVATPDQTVALYTLLGWFHWATGEASRAVHILRQALRLDETYELASLLEAYIMHGGIPRWAFEPGEQRPDPELSRAA